MKKKFTKKNIIELITIIGICLIAFIVIWFFGIITTISKNRLSVVTSYDSALTDVKTQSLDVFEDLLLLEKGDVIEQYFYNREAEFNGVNFALVADGYYTSNLLNEGHIITGMVNFKLQDMTDNSILVDKDFNLSEVPYIKLIELLVEKPLHNRQNDVFKISIEVIEVDNQRPVYIDMTRHDKYNQGSLYINGEENELDFVLQTVGARYEFVMNMYLLFCIFTLAVIVLLFFGIRIFNWKIQFIYLLLAVYLGVMFMALLPPYTAPDELTHINNCYYYSNKLLGIEDTKDDNTIYKRHDDCSVVFGIEPDINMYEAIYNNFFSKCNDNNLEISNFNVGLKSSWHMNIPGTLGITLGRVLNLGNVPTLYLGAILQYACFVLAMFFAIKITPIAKALFMVIGLLPMVLQQTTSYSYDAAVLIGAFMLIAVCLNMAYSSEKITYKHIILFGIFSILVVSVKSGAYAPICGMILLISPKRCSNKKHFYKVIGIGILVAALAFAIGNFGTIKGILGRGQSTPDTSNEVSIEDATGDEVSGDSDESSKDNAEIDKKPVNWIAWANSEGYTLDYLIEHSKFSLYIVYNTIVEYGDEFFTGMIGSPIGWFLPGWRYMNMLIFGFVILIIFSALKHEEETNEIDINNKHKIWMFFLGFASIGAVALAMLLCWTPIGLDYIAGIQGRYFLPVLPLIALLFRNNLVVSKKNMDNYIAVFALLLNFIAIETLAQLGKILTF